VKIYIPSKGRALTQTTAVQLMGADIPFEIVCSLDDPQLSLYKTEWGSSIIRTFKVSTIHEKRQKILELGGKLVMLDDDQTFYARQKDGSFKKASSKEVRKMFKWFDDALDTYAHAGIVDKFMSNTTPRGEVVSRRYNGVLGYNTALFKRPYPKFRIPVSEEHDVHLQLAAQGSPPIVSCEYSKGTTYYNAGGCTDERSRKSEAEGHKLFASLWPDLVKVVPSKTSISGLAIRVRWSKAVKHGT